MPGLGIFFLAIIGGSLLLIYLGKPKNKSEERAMKRYNEEQKSKKYNYYKYTCPMCKSNRVTNISTTSKIVSSGMFGLASDKIGKCYQCEDCKYKW